MQLRSLLRSINYNAVIVSPEIEVNNLTIDSRSLQPGDCFLAYPGTQVDGRSYIKQALAAGAAVVLYEANNLPAGVVPDDSEQVLIPIVDLVQKIGLLAAHFFGSPGAEMKITGITGTNGKTTISHALAQAQTRLNGPTAVMGTLGVGLLPTLDAWGMTTADAVSVQCVLAKLRAAGARAVAMEVSSHALCQSRVVGVPFDVAIFTQLSPDHLDYHGTMESYAQAKEKLLLMPGLQRAVINADDAVGLQWIARHKSRLQVLAYSLQESPPDVNVPLLFVESSTMLTSGLGYRLSLKSPWGDGVCETRLLGTYNIANLLAVIGALCMQGFPWKDVLAIVADIAPVPGRMQWFGGDDGPTVIVDYAHTPDALEQVLATLRPLCAGDLHCVFGCGGNRDRQKRPLMGAVAAKWADRIWITNDNPRDESPEQIVAQVQPGCGAHAAVTVELDRERAIHAAVAKAASGDFVLVAGKGHECEQVIGERVISFSDIACVRALCE